MTNTVCQNCFGTIHIMIFQGQDYCSENCRKDLETKAKSQIKTKGLALEGLGFSGLGEE